MKFEHMCTILNQLSETMLLNVVSGIRQQQLLIQWCHYRSIWPKCHLSWCHFHCVIVEVMCCTIHIGILPSAQTIQVSSFSTAYQCYPLTYSPRLSTCLTNFCEDDWKNTNRDAGWMEASLYHLIKGKINKKSYDNRSKTCSLLTYSECLINSPKPWN